MRRLQRTRRPRRRIASQYTVDELIAIAEYLKQLSGKVNNFARDIQDDLYDPEEVEEFDRQISAADKLLTNFEETLLG